jgi:hypothetical protein
MARGNYENVNGLKVDPAAVVGRAESPVSMLEAFLDAPMPEAC